MQDRNIYQIAFIIALVLAGLVLLFLIVKYTFLYLLPFILAIILTSLIEPFVSILEKKIRLHRSLAVAFSLALIITILALLISAGASRLFFEFDRLIRTLPDYQEALALLQVIWDHDRLQEILEAWEFSPQLREALEEGISEVYNTFTNALRMFFKTLQDGTKKAVNLVVVLLFTFIATFFMSKDKDYLSKAIGKMVPKRWQKEAIHFRDELYNSTIGYIKAILILISITTVITIIGLEVIGSNYALLLGLLSGILDLIPILGPGIIFTPWILYSFLSSNAPFGIMLLLLYGTMVVVRSYLEPKVIGERIGVHPLATVIALYLGLRVFGPIGVIVGPGVLMIAKATIRAGLLAHWKIFRWQEEE